MGHKSPGTTEKYTQSHTEELKAEIQKYHPVKEKMKQKIGTKLLSLENQILEDMDIQAEKLHLIEELTRIQDIHIIEQIKQLLKKAHNPIVGYNANGHSITQRDFIQQIEQAENEHKSGNYQTINEVEKESESW